MPQLDRSQRIVPSPRKYLNDRPLWKSIKLGSRHIDLAKLCECEGYDPGYLSHILSGNRTPSLAYATRLADSLGMTLQGLLDAIALRKSELDGIKAIKNR